MSIISRKELDWVIKEQALIARIVELETLLKECANDIAARVDEAHGIFARPYLTSDQMRKYQFDMELVNRARRLLMEG